MMPRPHVVDLSGASDVAAVGGKAYSLGRMIRNGFRVPEGFLVTTHAFQAMTRELEREILQQFDVLKTDHVAVRSSAVAEDAADAAWAGQLDTFLNTPREQLIDAIERCWESVNSARAKAYAEQKSLKGSAVGVIIQKMIQSDVSGVAFSAHPITKSADHIVIEAGLGLGEAIVSGYITPDTYITYKSLEGLEKHTAHQTKKLIKDATDQNIWVDLETEGEAQKLTDEQIYELAELVLELEKYFDSPVDVEWALKDKTFYVLQSRPITTL